MKIFKKIISVILMIIILMSSTSFSNKSFASIPMNTANMFEIGLCNTGLKYWSNQHHQWFDVDCYFTLYEKDGIRHPAYCLNADNDGVGQVGAYIVDVNTELQNAQVNFDMDNQVIWRTISNGYPYKTPEQLGVTTIEDAYLVTKRAVHANLYNVDVMNQYSTSNAHDVVVLNAINTLTNIGRNGTLTKDDYAIQIVKDGDFYKENNYYVQKFKVTGNTAIDIYTITTAENMPSGAIITNSNGTQISTFNSDESFYVKVPNESMLSNISTLIRVQGRCKTYPIYYGATRISGTQNYALTYDPYEDLATEITFNADVYKSGIIITKKDVQTGKTLEGVTYNAKYQDGTEIGNYTTNSEGKITINNLRPDKVVLTEISTRDKYILDTTPIEVELEYMQTKEIELTNEKITATLIINKEIITNDNADTSLLDLSNFNDIKFRLVAKENIIDVADGSIMYVQNQEVGTYSPNENGILRIDNLPLGKYEIQEVSTQKGLLLDYAKYEIEFTENNLIGKLKVTNDTTLFEFSKTDITGQEELEGAELEVIDERGNIVDRWTSSKNRHYIEGLEIGKQYILRERIPPRGYVRATDILFSVSNSREIQKVQMIDKVVEISKVDITGQAELAGAELEIIDKDGTIVDTWTSTEEKHFANGLKVGEEYTLREKIAPNGYVKATDITFKVNEDNEIQKVQMIDKVVEISKTDITTGEELEGAKLQVTDENDTIIDEWTSTAETHKVIGLEENKKYKLKETTAPYGYEIAETIEFIVTDDKETQKIEMKDAPILKNIKVKKIDEDTKEIIKGDFTFGIYEDTKCKKLIKEVNSNAEDATVLFEDVRYGIYYIKEITAPYHYYLSDRIVKVEITNNGIFVDGEISKEIDNTITFEYENKIIVNPQTGDNSHIEILAVIAMLSLLGIIFIKIKMNKENKNSK